MGDKTEKEKHKKISSLMRNGWLRSTISRQPQRHSIPPYPDILPPLNTQHLSGTIDVKGVGDQEKPGATPPSHRMFRPFLGTNATAWSASPRSKRGSVLAVKGERGRVQCICCFLTNRLLRTCLMADSTKAVEMVDEDKKKN